MIAVGLLIVLLLAGCTTFPPANNPDQNNDSNGQSPADSDIPFPDANSGDDMPTQLPF